MKPHPATLDPATLLEHAAWMRALARKLVVDAALADDVVQDAWQAALARPPRRGVPLPAWLATVVRNKALTQRREIGRRVAREALAARDERAPSTAELVERADTQRVLVERVLALPESQRDVILLRFFDGLKPAAIAARLGVPVNTVRTRLARGLGRLRGELDELYDGDRRASSLALVPLASLAGAERASVGLLSSLKSLGTGAWIMSHPFRSASLALVLVAAGLGLRGWSARVEGADEAARFEEAVQLFAPPMESAAGPSERVPVTGDSVQGVVVDLDGAPIPGATIRTRSSRQARITRRGAATDAAGRFEVELADDQASIWLWPEREGYVALRDGQVEAGGDPVELAMTRIDTAPLEVVVVNRSTQTELPRFTVTCLAVLQDGHGAERSDQRLWRGEELDGPLRRELPFARGFALRVRVEVIADVRAEHSVRAEKLVEPEPGHTTRVVFELDLDAAERAPGAVVVAGRVVDDATGAPIGGARVELHPLLGAEPAGAERPAGQPSFGLQDRQVLALADGSFRIAIDDGAPQALVSAYHPRYAPGGPQLFDGGGEVVLRLRPHGSVSGVVVDPNGDPLAGQPLEFRRFDPAETHDLDLPDETRRRILTDIEGCFRFDHVPAATLSIAALSSLDGSSDEAKPLIELELAQGEERELRLEVAPTDRVTIRGQVFDVGSCARIPIFVPLAAEGAPVIAEPRGIGYVARDVAPGEYLVVLGPANDDCRPWRVALIPGVRIDGKPEQSLDLFEPQGSLRGSVRLDGALAADGGLLRVRVVPVLPAGVASKWLERWTESERVGTPVGEDGSFRVEGISPGRHRVELWRARTKRGEREVEVELDTILEEWVVD